MPARRPNRWLGSIVSVATLALSAACTTSVSTESSPDELVGAPTSSTTNADGAEGAAEEDREYRRGALWYRIAVSGSELEITVRLLHPASRTSFFLPTSSQVPEPNRAVSLRGAEGPDGALPLRQLPDDGRIDVETSGAAWVELHYRIDLHSFPNDSSRPHPDFDGGAILVYLPSVLVVPSKQVVEEIREIPVEIHAPDDWSVFASWAGRSRASGSTEDDVHGFVARDIRSLRDAFFVAGGQVRTRKRQHGNLTVAFQPDVDLAGGAATERRFASRVSRILQSYEGRFGDVEDTLVYVRPSNRETNTNVRGTAKRSGFVVRLPDRRPLRDSVELLVAHEAFHLWNGHRLIPEPETEQRTRWFKEGVTHYVALKTLRELGLFDLDDVRRELAKSAFFYRRNPASRGGRASRLDMNRLPYDRGVLLALALDGALGHCTGFDASVHDWIRALLDRPQPRYNPERLRAAFLQTAGQDCKAAERIWQRHLENPRPIDPAPLFKRVGLHYLEASTVEETEVLPLESHRRTFQTLFEGSRTPSTGEPTAEHNRSTNRPAQR